MYRNSSPRFVRASFIAGPLFLTSTNLALLYLKLPHPIEVGVDQLYLFLMMLLPSAMVGTLLAMLPNLIGGAFMNLVALRFAAFRAPIAWAAVGAAIGLSLALATEAPGALAFGLVITSAFCARICRNAACWE